MKRREVLAALFVAALPSRASAADRARRIGYLSAGAGTEEMAKRLAELGWVEGRNLQFEIRLAPPSSDTIAMKLAAEELVRANPDILLAFTDRTDALAAATKTIPIVSGFHADPVGMGLAKTLRRPGGNVTGLSTGSRESASAWIGLLRVMRPRLARIVIVHGPRGEARMRIVSRSWREMGESVGIAFSYAPCAEVGDVARAFEALGDPATGAAFLVFGGMTTVALPEGMAKDVVDLALKRRIATLGDARGGALMDYFLSYSDSMGRMAAIIDKILRGANPADIPYELPDRTEFILNRATAKAIGAVITPELLLRATEVIG